MKQIAQATVTSTDTPYKHNVQTRGFDLVADEPPGDAGPGPYDYYLAGLGACTAITLRMYAERKGWDLGAVTVELSLSRDAEGDTAIERVLHASGSLSDAQWQRLLEIADKTPVTRSVREGARVDTRWATD